MLSIIKFLTHLEGMGVLSASRLRVSEDGLLDNDYKTLLNNAERTKRVNRYFKIFNKLQNNRKKSIRNPHSPILNIMSGRKTRLWYVTGCHMAQKIEQRCGMETVRKLVKQGSDEFFNTYMELAT